MTAIRSNAIIAIVNVVGPVQTTYSSTLGVTMIEKNGRRAFLSDVQLDFDSGAEIKRAISRLTAQ